MDETRKRTRTIGRAAIGAVVAAAIAMAGLGLAFADAPAQDAPEAPSSSNVSAYHEGMGFDFAALAGEKTDGMTAAEASKATVGSREFCLQCHDWDAIVEATYLPGDVTVYNKQGQYNVHDNHNGLVDCKDCHTIDGTSNLVCVTCHYMELPEGWEGFY